MPQLISHIDAIARQKQRDVLFVTFHDETDDAFFSSLLTDYESLPVRQQFIAWLDVNAIEWQACGDFANTNCMMPYRGQMYLDLPYDETNPHYQQLSRHLEKADGSMRIQGIRFCYTTLATAVINAHHDEPGFWENWAEKF